MVIYPYHTIFGYIYYLLFNIKHVLYYHIYIKGGGGEYYFIVVSSQGLIILEMAMC